MFVIFKKRLVVDSNNVAITRTTEILEKHMIKYELRTTRSRGSIGSRLDALSYARSNIAMYKGSAMPDFVYMIYVKRRDFTRAKQLISTKE